MMHNKRSTQIVPKIVWEHIRKVFPRAILHNYQPPSNECIGNCKDCQREKESEKQFPSKIKEWKSNIKLNPQLMLVLDNKYTPTVGNDRFGLFHREQVQGWRNACIYLSKKKRNVATQTIKAKLRQLCPSSSSLLICEEHKQTVIPNYSVDMNLVDLNVEWFCEDLSNALFDSMVALEDLIQEHEQASASGIRTKPPLAFIGENQKLVYIEPNPCNTGCVCLVSNKEDPHKCQEMQVVHDIVDDKPEEK